MTRVQLNELRDVVKFQIQRPINYNISITIQNLIVPMTREMIDEFDDIGKCVYPATSQPP